MKVPFEYGELVEQDRFINRVNDKLRLKQNFSNSINTMIISPRRWGKTSLVRQVASEINPNEVRVCFLDMFQVRDENEFYKMYATALIKACSTKYEEWGRLAVTFLRSLSPKVTIEFDPSTEMGMSLDLQEIGKHFTEVLNLAEQLAIEKKIRIAVCIDEFQSLSRFDDPLLFQQRLRSVWQHHKHVSYCLYGSKKHMMIELFQMKSMPFYKFGDVIMLDKIATNEWVDYIVREFSATKKDIGREMATRVVATVENHSYYVQQLAHILWVRTRKSAGEEEFSEAINDLVNQNSMLYHRDAENLTSSQINFICALLDQQVNFHSAEIINRYKLGSSSNVTRIKEALEKKEIIDNYGPGIVLLDPVFGLWFRRMYKSPA